MTKNTKKKTNNYFAPIAIAGITVGLLASAYKFVFAEKQDKSNEIQKTVNEKKIEKDDQNRNFDKEFNDGDFKNDE
ncbi:hypothetical protein A6M14_03135 [Acinetobacter sp. Ac_877]|uniref:hypothetical protein n=1 Tax=Acinetobacter portensis TaxID=1839785 RepID=UPI00128BA44E|nr:hypothetical protein [Acinetobacter portensis]MPW40266.1 hypothetical protein [Acinetobacter portensis]